jgi:hypothetical protein
MLRHRSAFVSTVSTATALTVVEAPVRVESIALGDTAVANTSADAATA